MHKGLGAGAVLLASVLAQPALAQAPNCAIPTTVPVPRPVGPTDKEPARQLPIGGYTLALSWSPEYCHGHKEASFQCGGSTRFGFVLHGLWPDGQGREWPQFCKPADILPPQIVRGMMCTTPSADLIQHEWAKHGTCTGSDPAAYFAQARALYQGLRFPDMRSLSYQRGLTVGVFRAAFAKANPAVPVDALRVTTTKNGWLEEVWLCLDGQRRFARCGRDQGGGKPANWRIKVWRGEGRTAS